MTVTLHQFRYSHYNEKARWALDFKAVVHERVSYLPGPHAAAMQRLSGQQQTPVLVWDGEVIAGSARIIDTLEARVPSPALIPEDLNLAERVAVVRQRFDVEVGPAVRTALFSVLINEGGYACGMFAEGEPWLKRTLYRAMFPLARPMIARANGVVDPENVKRAFELSREALDYVAQQSAPTGYLVGDQFTAADLTAAALLAPLADVSHPDMARPTPVPDALREFLAPWSEHPGIAWVEGVYEAHRPPRADARAQ